jgi:hypothetical protein
MQEGDLSIISHKTSGAGLSLVEGEWVQKGRLSLDSTEQGNPKGDAMGGIV